MCCSRAASQRNTNRHGVNCYLCSYCIILSRTALLFPSLAITTWHCFYCFTLRRVPLEIPEKPFSIHYTFVIRILESAEVTCTSSSIVVVRQVNTYNVGLSSNLNYNDRRCACPHFNEGRRFWNSISPIRKNWSHSPNYRFQPYQSHCPDTIRSRPSTLRKPSRKEKWVLLLSILPDQLPESSYGLLFLPSPPLWWDLQLRWRKLKTSIPPTLFGPYFARLSPSSQPEASPWCTWALYFPTTLTEQSWKEL